MNRSTAPLPLYLGLLPLVAVLIGIYGFDSGYLAVGIYHGGILICLIKRRSRNLSFPTVRWKWLVSLSCFCALTYPAILVLWPLMKRPGLEFVSLLHQWGMDGTSLWLFCFYSILVHPVLEESFWRGLMPARLESDLLFALFHVFVLLKVAHWPWAVLGFAILTSASILWRRIAEGERSLVIPVISHAIADLGVLLAVRHFL